MGCCEAIELKDNPNHIHRRNIRFDKIDFRNMSQTYTQEKVDLNSYDLTKQDKIMLNKTIMNHTYLYRLAGHQRGQLIQCFDSYSCKKNTKIFKKGDHATLFFIIRNGQVKIGKNQQADKSNIVLKRGDHFGELALLYTAPRSAQAVAVTDCEFLCISNQLFRKTIQQITKKNYEFAKRFIDKVLIFKYLTKRQKNLLTYHSHILKLKKQQTIFKEGDDANSFYVITSGKVQIRICQKQTLQLQAGQSFGQNSFRQNQFRSGTAIAIENTCLLSISRDSIRKCLNNQLQDINYYNILKWSLGRDSFFKLATNVQREKLIASIQVIEFKKDEKIMNVGENTRLLIIVLEGQVNHQQIGTIFNREYLTADCENDRKLIQDLIQTRKGKIGQIPFQIIYALFEKKLQTILSSLTSKNLLLELSSKRTSYINNLDVDSFIVKTKIGQGQHGKVYLVEDDLGKKYALKWIQKSNIIQRQIQKFVIRERQILTIVESPFILKMYKTFQDRNCIYFLLNFVDGVDLFDIMRENGLFCKKSAQFCLACLILIVEHLHEKNVVHRDLKPENIVVDASGYLCLADLGIAKILQEQLGFRTFTVIGTPHYMAPEIVELEGYSFSSDLWSIGVILYEMMCGQLPYGNLLDDPYEIFKQIFSKQLSFPKFLQDRSVKKIINKLLSKNSSGRFIENFSNLKNMQFFQKFDWQSLQKNQMKSPLSVVPKIRQTDIDQRLSNYLSKSIKYSAQIIESKYEKWDQNF